MMALAHSKFEWGYDKWMVKECRESFVMQIFCFATPDDVTESVDTQELRLQPSIVCMPQLQPSCSAVLLVPKLPQLITLILDFFHQIEFLILDF